ncbi:hypothetical protein BGZ63DRAFT_111046 [Mariannaea sp. PMI_226]|nr:hypothetical protein BGZ63DRAFT_111046 [Mariannaea sp. PMI_226]
MTFSHKAVNQTLSEKRFPPTTVGIIVPVQCTLPRSRDFDPGRLTPFKLLLPVFVAVAWATSSFDNNRAHPPSQRSSLGFYSDSTPPSFGLRQLLSLPSEGLTVQSESFQVVSPSLVRNFKVFLLCSSCFVAKESPIASCVVFKTPAAGTNIDPVSGRVWFGLVLVLVLVRVCSGLFCQLFSHPLRAALLLLCYLTLPVCRRGRLLELPCPAIPCPPETRPSGNSELHPWPYLALPLWLCPVYPRALCTSEVR